MSEPIDPVAVAQLNGIFAPVFEEIDEDRLHVVQGELPTDLVGAYVRNGPNPRFTPLGSYTYPIDGDAMVHGVWFDGEGGVRYRNRFVRTPALATEERAGRALWPGTLTGEFPDATDVGADLAGTERDLVNINIVRQGGRLLALSEGQVPYELDADLATIGPFDFHGQLPSGIGAHPKVDPTTGEMIVFRYGVIAPPWLTWSVVGPDGDVVKAPAEVSLDGSFMIHDFTITASFLVFFVCPLRFDIGSAMRGGQMLAWEPERGTRIVVVRRDDGRETWFDADPFWVWHFVNAYEPDDAVDGAVAIVVEYAAWTNPSTGLVSEPARGTLERARLDLDSGSVSIERLLDEPTEFPRLDDRQVGRAHRWFHVAADDPTYSSDVAGEWNRLLRIDRQTGAQVERRGGSTFFGEAVFAPRAGSDEPDDGYLMTYAYDSTTLQTDLVVLHAADISGEPAVTIRMPQRVPFGLHGNWLAAR